MKNKLMNKFLVVLALTIGFTSCDTVDYGDTNVNTNSPSDASPGALLTSAERSVSSIVDATAPNLYAQYLSNGQYADESQYSTLNWSFNGWYSTLIDLQNIVELNSNEATATNAQAYGSNANQIAAASILRVYFLKHMTERWGRIPYTEALMGLDNPYPVFDSQESIYNGLISELDAALAMIDGGNGPAGDYIFGGDMSQWETFGNTMKLVMGLRMSNADPSTGQAWFNDALSEVISSNAENLYYPYLGEEANDNPWEDRFQTRRDYLLADTFVDALIGSGTSTAPEDPRLFEMGEPAFNTGEFTGAPYGEINSATDNYAWITDDIIFNQQAPLYMFTYSEVLFARAEAAELGWTNEDAESLYEQAIQASMDQWGVATADATAYIAANPYAGLESIGYEKWVALYLQGYESWTEWRRMLAMGYEKELDPPAQMLGGATGIPNRHAYSATAAQLNEDNYEDAVSAQGPDDLNTTLWLFD